MPRFVYVVARDRRDLYERLCAEFAGQDDVAVVLDRRYGQRRTVILRPGQDGRRSDRRRQSDLDVQLRTEGVVLTACSDVVLVTVR
jgi:hypothetical protein